MDKFLGQQFDEKTRMYGPYPEEMRIEVLAACDTQHPAYGNGVYALGTLFSWKDRWAAVIGRANGDGT